MKVAFALLAHKYPLLVERMIRLLVAQGHRVVVHYDLKSSLTSYQTLVNHFVGHDSVRFARRVSVGWGQWGVVQGVLNCLDEIEAAGWEPDYVYHISCLDYPIRASTELVAFLKRNQGDEFIESVRSDDVRWVKTGPQKERYQYRWFFNWREQSFLTELFFYVQRVLRLERPFVRDLVPHIGSQWWVLTWPTLKKVMKLAREPDIIRFFTSTLVPDEVFFQTLVRHVVPESRIVSRTLTLYQFSDYGTPVVYHLDHIDYLLRQPFFWARKLSAHTDVLRDRLDPYWQGERRARPFKDEDVGIVGPDYEDRRLAYRDGPPGRPVAGRSFGSWYDDQRRLTTPYFAIIGTSTAELRLLHRAAAGHPALLFHGQLFHPTRIEFAGNLPFFGGYGSDDLDLREASAPNFLSDIVRAERDRMSGFLLRWGQGWHIPEVMIDRPNIRVMIVRGTPLTAFIENVLGIEPTLDQSHNVQSVLDLPPDVVANRFRRFLPGYQQHMAWLDDQENKGLRLKPKGWMANIDFTKPTDNWHETLAAFLGIELIPERWREDTSVWSSERLKLNDGHAEIAEMLVKGGIRQDIIDMFLSHPKSIPYNCEEFLR